MQKFIIFIFFAFQIPVNAEPKEWTLIHSDKIQGISFFISLGDFPFINNKTRMWVMENFEQLQQVQHLKYNSTKSLVQFDCKLNTMRILAYSLHKSPNASGNAIFNKSVALEWTKIKENSINEAYQDIACHEASAINN
mgnify:FL=1|tara:strand:- start:6845 stop:7258 length:414 start_codon:yes stop_codon:yes gene_type:complete